MHNANDDDDGRKNTPFFPQTRSLCLKVQHLFQVSDVCQNVCLAAAAANRLDDVLRTAMSRCSHRRCSRSVGSSGP